MRKQFIRLLLVFGLIALFSLSACFDDGGGGDGGKKCCEVSCSGNGMGPWCHRKMDSCPADSLGEVSMSFCE